MKPQINTDGHRSDGKGKRGKGQKVSLFPFTPFPSSPLLFPYLRLSVCICGFTCLQMLIEPLEHVRVPELGVLRFENPVPLVREIDQLRLDAPSLKCREELQAFADRNTEIKLAVRDEQRRLEIFHEHVWRPFLVNLRLLPRHTLELPIDE